MELRTSEEIESVPDSQETIFQKYLPDTLYMTHYELATQFPPYSPELWRQYLRDNEKFIMKEVAAITETEARKSLKRLSEGKLMSQDVAAIKQILDRSEQINKTNQDSRTFVTAFLPNPNKPKEEPIDEVLLARNLYYQNQQKIHAIFFDQNDPYKLKEMNYYQRVAKGEIIQNEDGTITIPNPITEEDAIYTNSQPIQPPTS